MKSSNVNRLNVGTYTRLVQGRKLRINRAHIEAPTFVAVCSGEKHLRWAGHEQVIHPGEVVALAADQTFDVINTPCSKTGLYEAQVLTCADPVIQLFLERKPKGRRIKDVYPLQSEGTGLLESFRHACAAFDTKERLPDAILSSRLLEMLTWLDHQGGYFGVSSHAQITLKVRQLLGSDPGQCWTATVVAQHLAMSEATLRRRLAQEQTSFQRLLLDVRMSRALTLLQVTNLPINSVACEVGYSCSSRFAFRFRQSFGHSPSDFRQGESLSSAF